MRACPGQSIYGEKNIIHVIEQGKCTKCGECFDVCPPRFDAVKKLSGVPVPSVEHGIKVERKKKPQQEQLQV